MEEVSEPIESEEGDEAPRRKRNSMAGQQQESWFTKWLRNGRLSALTWLVVFTTWVGFQIAKLPPAPILDQLLLTISGVLVGNLAIKKSADDKAADEKANKEKADGSS